MRRYLIGAVIAAAGIVGAVALAQPMASTGLASLGGEVTQAAQRACVFPIGGWTIVDCSAAAAAQSGQLASFARYVVQCGDDSYFAMGDESTDEADSSDGWIPSGAWLEVMTTDRVRYLSCKNKNSDSDCRYIACQ